MRYLIIGGSGGLSGCLAQRALRKGHEVWTLTRGIRPVPDGVHSLRADREQTQELKSIVCGQKMVWDAVFDCVCMKPLHAMQDLEIFPGLTGRLVVVSTDSVYDPTRKSVPQEEENAFFVSGDDYAGQKRKMEEVFLSRREERLPWTLLRPGHIYGPGFRLGCFPEHSRQEELLERIRQEKTLYLVGGGRYLTQPVFVEDLADSMMSCARREETRWEIYNIGGPEAVENRLYYEIIGRLTGHPVTVEEIPEKGYREAHPEFSGHLCHRSYSLNKLRGSGVQMPATSLEEGLRRHIEWLEELRLYQ